MFANHFAAAIEAAHPAQLDACARDLWKAHGASQLTDTDAQELAEAIEARRGVRRAGVQAGSRRSSIFPKRREQPARRHPERIDRRRQLASSGPLPTGLAKAWTTTRLAILRIVGDEVREHGACDLTLAEIAARAGSCRTMARTTLRQAAKLGLVLIEERPRRAQKNLPNRIRIVSDEWLTWLKRGPRNTLATILAALNQTGSKKTPLTDNSYISIGAQTAKTGIKTNHRKGLGRKKRAKRPIPPDK